MVGEDVKIKADEHALRDLFRQWIEPILAVLVAVLIGLVTWLIVLVLDVQTAQDNDGDERARGSANVCRMLNALGLDVTSDENSRCLDPEVLRHWEQFQGETTRSVTTTGEVLDLMCIIVAESALIPVLPDECEGRLTPTDGG